MAYSWNKWAVKWLLDKCKATFLPKDQFREAFLGWGGEDIIGDISPIDASMSSLHSANRAELCNPAGITIEYTTDGGKTWLDYGNSDSQKVMLLSSNGYSHYLGKAMSAHTNTNVGLRVTLDAHEMGVYTFLRKILLNWTSSGVQGATVTFEKALYKDPDTWVADRTCSIMGWSGWNSYSFPAAFGGWQEYNYVKMRMTFLITGVSSTYNNRASLDNIIILGTTYWVYPSTIAKTGHLYSYDWRGNATFPGNVQAKTLNGHTLRTDVPPGAKFTDTTYEVATQEAQGLMSAADKKKLDGLSAGSGVIKTHDVPIPIEAWIEEATEDGYRYAASISLPGVTVDNVPIVTFADEDVDYFYPTAQTGAGTVTVWADDIPDGTVTVKSIVIL